MEPTTDPAITHLNPAGGSVMVTTDDEDRFVMPMPQAVTACVDYMRSEEGKAAMLDLFRLLKQWTRDHAADVREAYITPVSGALRFLVAPRSVRFNEALGDALSDLEVRVVEDERFARFLPFEAVAIPMGSPDGWIGPPEVTTRIDAQP
jgi:hypothetical protein